MKFTKLPFKICTAGKVFLFTSALLLAGTRCPAASEPVSKTAPVKVEIRLEDGRYQLLVNHQPFYIKGAGLEFGSQEKLAAHGGNTFRTWRTENGRESGR